MYYFLFTLTQNSFFLHSSLKQLRTEFDFVFFIQKLCKFFLINWKKSLIRNHIILIQKIVRGNTHKPFLIKNLKKKKSLVY